MGGSGSRISDPSKVKADLTKVASLRPFYEASGCLTGITGLEVGGARRMERGLLGKEGLMPMTALEVRRLLYRLMEETNKSACPAVMLSKRRQ